MPAPPQQFLEWNKVTFRDLSVSDMKAFARELEKLGVFWKLKNQEVEGLLDFYIFVLCFKPNLNSGTEIHPTWNNTVEIIALTQSYYRHWWTQFKLPDDCGRQITGKGPFPAGARVTLWTFVEHLNSLGYLQLNLPVTDDEQNNFKLVTIVTPYIYVSEKMRGKKPPCNFLDLVVVT